MFLSLGSRRYQTGKGSGSTYLLKLARGSSEVGSRVRARLTRYGGFNENKGPLK